MSSCCSSCLFACQCQQSFFLARFCNCINTHFIFVFPLWDIFLYFVSIFAQPRLEPRQAQSSSLVLSSLCANSHYTSHAQPHIVQYAAGADNRSTINRYCSVFTGARLGDLNTLLAYLLSTNVCTFLTTSIVMLQAQALRVVGGSNERFAVNKKLNAFLNDLFALMHIFDTHACAFCNLANGNKCADLCFSARE